MSKRIFYIANSVLSIVAAFTLLPYVAAGQVKQTHRFEKEMKFNDELYTIISLEEEGLALLREKNKFDGTKRRWEVVVLDTVLQEKKTIEFKVDERYPLNGYEVKKNHLFLLYRTGETIKHSLVLLDLNLRDSSELRYEIKPEFDLRITHFTVAGNTMVLGGYVGSDPTLLLYDMAEKNMKVLPGFFQKDTELIDVRVNQNETFNIVMIDRSSRSERKIVFRTFDESGTVLLEDIVPIDDDVSLQTTISSSLKREDLLISGTWSVRNAKQSSGFFAMPVDPFREQEVKFYHFGQLENFLNYLPAKRAGRIKSNTIEDLKLGKKPSFTAYVIPYRLFETASGYTLVAEVYNASNISPYQNYPYNSPFYTNPYYLPSTYWMGYYPGMRYRPGNYSQAPKENERIRTYATVAVNLDSTGNLLWDESVKLEDIEQSGIEQVGDFYTNGYEVFFIYKKESELKIKTASTANKTVTEETQLIKLSHPGDNIRNERDTEDGLRYWISNAFYTWGYQTIKNNASKDRSREVFYVNKIVVR